MSEVLQGEQVNQEVVEQQTTEPQRQLLPEEQEAIDRYRESIGAKEKPSVVDTDYNEDGTPKENLIDGKFKSQDDLLNAYKELEKKLSQQNKPEEQQPQQEEQQESPISGLSKESFDKYGKEFAETGSLTDASYAELEKLGFSKAEVNRYIESQQTYVSVFSNKVYDVAGGQEAYTSLVQWAADNADPQVIEEYNKALAALDTATAVRNLEYMKFKYDQQNTNQAPRRLQGETQGQGVVPFADKNEWQKAQTNRLYGKDKKYTQMVDARYLVSRRKGIL